MNNYLHKKLKLYETQGIENVRMWQWRMISSAANEGKLSFHNHVEEKPPTTVLPSHC